MRSTAPPAHDSVESEERLITAYGGTRVRMDLDRIPLWTDRHDITVDAL